MFQRGMRSAQYSKMSVMIRIDGRGGYMYVPRAMYSLSRSFWIVPRDRRRIDALLLGDELVQQQQDRRRRVDRHRRRDLVERDALRAARACRRSSRSPRRPCRPRPRRAGDRSRSPSASAGRTRTTGRSGRRPSRKWKRSLVAGGVAEAGVLAHRPQPAAVHRRVDAAGERRLARHAELRRRGPIRRGRRPCRAA